MIKLSKTNRLSAGDKCDEEAKEDEEVSSPLVPDENRLVSEQESTRGSHELEKDVGAKVLRLPQSKARQIFAENALELLKYDFSVIPIGFDRQPAIKGFQKRRNCPKESTVQKWIERFPAAQIAIHCYSSRLVVLDGDDGDTVDAIHESIGWSPLRVNTLRGEHSYFKPARDLKPRDLRALGVNADLKGPQKADLVIAPPSLHKAGSFQYSWADGCEMSARYDLPTLTNDDLNKFIEHKVGSLEKAKTLYREHHQQNYQSNGRDKDIPMSGPLYKGQRSLGLNKRMAREAPYCENEDEIYYKLLDINEDVCNPPITNEKRLKKLARDLFTSVQNGSLVPMIGQPGRAFLNQEQINAITGLGTSASQAVPLLMVLMINHMARHKRGQPFKISSKDMSEKVVIDGWKRDRYRTAIIFLLEAKAILRIGRDKKTGAYLYQFGPLVTGRG